MLPETQSQATNMYVSPNIKSGDGCQSIYIAFLFLRLPDMLVEEPHKLAVQLDEVSLVERIVGRGDRSRPV
jgi:hypothetical protein